VCQVERMLKVPRLAALRERILANPVKYSGILAISVLHVSFSVSPGVSECVIAVSNS